MNTNDGQNRENVVNNATNKTIQKGKVQQKLYTLSIVTIMVSIITIVVSFPNILVGTLIIIFKGNVKLPHSPSGPIWSGALVLVCGIQCLLLSWMGFGYIDLPPSSSPNHMRTCNDVGKPSVFMTILSLLFFGFFVLYCPWSLDAQDHCTLNIEEQMLLNLLAIVISLIIIICSIVRIILLRSSDKALGTAKHHQRVL
ncbi:uncharacterized protein LOC133186051 [Saccostrea echinata]|uniref:uncharacterized protein LOC133186051 n=1 Tax=Saccostrea echinata TaxID=191078 RepID=UPI002A7F4181|nr:uncharacterized protein LOC133186051 [Saccostrea echinata]